MRKALFIVAAILVLLVAASPAHARPEASTICHHVVRWGETLFCIARAYGVDPWAIASYNGIVNPNHIHPGQVLAIPSVYATIPSGPVCVAQPPYPSPTPVCGTCNYTHTIVSGENLYRISLYYGVSMWRIAACNSIYDLNYIRSGDTLCIPAP